MGYSEEIKKVYGADLLDGDNHKSLNDILAFNAGDIMGVISNDTIWRKVSLQDRINLMPNIPSQHSLINND